MGIGKRLGTQKHPLQVTPPMLGTRDLPASIAQSKLSLWALRLRGRTTGQLFPLRWLNGRSVGLVGAQAHDPANPAGETLGYLRAMVGSRPEACLGPHCTRFRPLADEARGSEWGRGGGGAQAHSSPSELRARASARTARKEHVARGAKCALCPGDPRSAFI